MSTLLPLNFNVDIIGWSYKQQRKQFKAFALLERKIMSSHNNVCNYCGFREVLPEIVNIDGNYRNNVPSNLTCACVICARCKFIGSYQSSLEEVSGDRLIYLPEIPQAAINYIYRVLCINDTAHAGTADQAKEMYRGMRYRSQHIEDLFGEGSSEVQIFLQNALDAKVMENPNFAKVMSNIRYLPGRHSFDKLVPYWREQLYPVKKQ